MLLPRLRLPSRRRTQARAAGTRALGRCRYYRIGVTVRAAQRVRNLVGATGTRSHSSVGESDARPARPVACRRRREWSLGSTASRMMRPPLPLIFVGLAASAAAQSAPPVAAGGYGVDAMAATKALFRMTAGFMDAVYRSVDVTVQLISGGDSPPKNLAWESIKVANHGGFAVCYYVGLLYLLLMPVIGLIYGISRCRGKGNKDDKDSRSEDQDSRSDDQDYRSDDQDYSSAMTKRSVIYALVFIAATYALFGSARMLVSNRRKESLFRPSSPSDGLSDDVQANVNALINVTNVTAEALSATTVKTLDIAQERITGKIGNAGNPIVDQVLNAISVNELIDCAGSVTRDIPTLNSSLAATTSKLKESEDLFLSLISRLSAVKSNLSFACDAEGALAVTCLQEVNIDLPRNDLLDWVQPVDGAVESFMSELVRLNSLLDITSKVKAANKTVIEAVERTFDQDNSVAHVGIEQVLHSNDSDDGRLSLDQEVGGVMDVARQFQNLSIQALNISAYLSSSISQVIHSFHTPLFNITTPVGTGHVQDFFYFERYVSITIGSFFGLLVFLSYLCLGFGTCCRRPDFSSSSCNKYTGANLLLAVFGLFLILSWLLMLVTTIWYPVSAVNITCLAVHEPENRLPMDQLSQLPLNVDQANLTYGDIAAGLTSCKNNRSVYDAGLKKVPGVKSFLDQLQKPISTDAIRHRLADVTFKETVREFLPDNLLLNISSSVQRLSELAMHLSNVIHGDHVSAVERQLYATNLTAVAAGIKGKYPEQANELAKILNDVVAIVQNLNSIKPSASDIQKWLTSVIRLKNLTSVAVMAQDRNLTRVIHKATFKVLSSVESVVYQEGAALRNEIMNGSSCLPIYQQFLSTVDVVCAEMLMPLSGLWLYISWCIVVFVPLIAFSLVIFGHCKYRSADPPPPKKTELPPDDISSV